MKETLKKISIGLVVLPLFGVLLLSAGTRGSSAAVQDFDAAATYKAKCAMCHGQKAEKKFDPAKDDAVHISITMKGRDDVTPKMPGYEAKGLTEEQAKTIVAYMRSIRQ